MTTLNRPVFVAAWLLCATGLGQSSTYVDNNGPRTIKWDQMANTIVEVDGLAWGAQSKGLGAHLVLPFGKVYLRNIDLAEADLNGRLLHVSGVLRKGQMGKAPKGVQGYSSSFSYFFVEVIDARRIDKLVRDQLLPSPHDWLIPGISIEAANDLIRARQFRRYGLSLAVAPDGSKAHFYQVGDNELIVFYELNGRVKSVDRVELKGVSRGGHKWVRLPAYRLQPLRKGQ